MKLKDAIAQVDKSTKNTEWVCGEDLCQELGITSGYFDKELQDRFKSYWLAFVLASVLVLSCAPKPVHAQTTEVQGENFSVIVYEPYGLNTIGLHLGTYHFSQNKVSSNHAQGNWNDFNPGVYVKLNNGMTFGTYYNSERKQSFYVGKTFSKNLGNNLEIAATVGVISGYNKSVLPLVLPTVAYKFHQDFAARVGFVPKVNKQGSTGLHLMIEKQF